MARKKLPPELKAKNHTFKLYDWEVEKVKGFIKRERMFQNGSGKNEIETEIKKCFKVNEQETKDSEELMKENQLLKNDMASCFIENGIFIHHCESLTKIIDEKIKEENKLVKLLKDIDRLLQMHDCGWCDDIGGCCDYTQCTRKIVRKKIRNYFGDVHTVHIGNIEVREVER